tara:strand:- start:85 stop:1143 length:1059 start_codon:yes stop_codon:yes gene_type:complete
MATRTGILSNASAEVNCEAYKPLPVGYANANFTGGPGNPFLLGIKTPKYQRAAPRPVSADVMAVNHAQLMGGVNKFADARAMLDFYIVEGKKFKPPPVELRSLADDVSELHDFLFSGRVDAAGQVIGFGAQGGKNYTSKEDFINDYYALASGPVPRVFRENRGTAILKQTIGVAALAPPPIAPPPIATNVPTFKSLASLAKGKGKAVPAPAPAPAPSGNPATQQYTDRFFQAQRTMKAEIYKDLMTKLTRHGVDVASYKLGGQPKTTDLDTNIRELMRIVDVRGVVLNLDKIFQMPTLGALPPQVLGQTSSSSTGSGGATTGTALSQATTVQPQQGVALPTTSTTTQETAKK